MVGRPWHGRKRALTEAERSQRYRKRLKRERPAKPAKFFAGNAKDGKHYWLTPPETYASLDAEFAFDFDPCPHPRPNGFDGLTCEWGSANYVNPPFGVQPTAWVRKAIAEWRKGRLVVLVYPLDKWVLELLAAVGGEVRNLGDVRWCAIEDGSAGRGSGQHVACFILEPETTAPAPPP